MKKITIYSLVLIGLLCWLSPVYAANKTVAPMLSLLLAPKGGTVITKSVSGQPGTVVKILLGDDHPAGSVQYVKMGDKEVVPLSWDDMTNEIKVMVPPVAAGEYQASVVFEDTQTPTIPLTVLPFALPKGVTPDAVLNDVEQNLQTMFQSVTGFMGNTGYAQTNVDTLNGILSVFMDQYNQMTAEEKEFFATFLNNADIAGLLQEMEKAEARAAQAKTTSIKRSPPKPSCMTVTPVTDEYTCKTYDRWDELAKYRSYYQYLKFIDTCVNDCISYITDILGATDCVADAGRFAMLTKSITILGTAINSAKTVLGTMPIMVTDLDVAVNKTILSYYDETGFIATATMEPTSTVLGGIVHEMILFVGSKLKTKLKKIEDNACWLELANNEIDTVKGLLDQYIGDEYFKVDASDTEQIAMPPHKLYVETEYYTKTLTTFCAYTYTHYGDTLYVSESLTAWGGSEKQVSEEVIFKYPYTLSHEYSLTDNPVVDRHVLTIKNRPPELEDMTVSVDPKNELNEKITITLDSTDQECDRITKWEVVGTAKYGDLDESSLFSNELYYTLTNGSPTGNEEFTLQFFDGLEWGEMTLTIDLTTSCTYTTHYWPSDEPIITFYRRECTNNNNGQMLYETLSYSPGNIAQNQPIYYNWDRSLTQIDNNYTIYRYSLVERHGLTRLANSFYSANLIAPQPADVKDVSSQSNIDCDGDGINESYVINVRYFDGSGTTIPAPPFPCDSGKLLSQQEAVQVLLSYARVDLRPFPIGCHDWWDHYDDQGNWVECVE